MTPTLYRVYTLTEYDDANKEMSVLMTYLVRRIIRCGIAPRIRSIIARCSRLSCVYITHTHNAYNVYWKNWRIANLVHCMESHRKLMKIKLKNQWAQ